MKLRPFQNYFLCFHQWYTLASYTTVFIETQTSDWKCFKNNNVVAVLRRTTVRCVLRALCSVFVIDMGALLSSFHFEFNAYCCSKTVKWWLKTALFIYLYCHAGMIRIQRARKLSTLWNHQNRLYTFVVYWKWKEDTQKMSLCLGTHTHHSHSLTHMRTIHMEWNWMKKSLTMRHFVIKLYSMPFAIRSTLSMLIADCW